MFTYKEIVLLGLLLALCFSIATVNAGEEPLNPEGRASQVDEKLLPSEPIKDKDKWPKTEKGMRIVPYVLNEEGFTKDALNVFHQGISDIQNKTCIRYVERRTQEDYIYVYNAADGCKGTYGKKGGKQIIQLTNDCMLVRKKCVHELIHALGFHHMHQRVDRNNVIDIKWENIAADDQKWFYRYDNEWEKFDTGYDPWSCMHYAKKGFSKNGKNTMVPHKNKFLDVIGTQLTLSRGDATRINRMYDCPAPYE
ncbi:hypothetical protein HA402_009325 [Bradysia odoriphaga]|nr:hypothetical protein HA402_009325 [Bradysia odoriphaga]